MHADSYFRFKEFFCVQTKSLLNVIQFFKTTNELCEQKYLTLVLFGHDWGAVPFLTDTFELLLGPSLEMVHGHVRFIPLVFLAIIGGALACAATDPIGRVVGSSGYVWGLVPMHVLIF